MSRMSAAVLLSTVLFATALHPQHTHVTSRRATNIPLPQNARCAAKTTPLAPRAQSPTCVAKVENNPLPQVDEDEPGPVQDVLSGLTVAFSQLSKAIACSSIVGVNPLVGLWSSVVMGAAATLGVRQGVIAGSAAVVAVPLGVFVTEHGVELVPLVVLLAAIIEAAVGVFRLTRLIDVVSPEVLAGFLNGLGILLFQSQLKVFNGVPSEQYLPAVGTAVLCTAITQLLPRFTGSTAIPSSLIGLGLASILGTSFHLPTLASTTKDPSTFVGGLSSLPTPTDLSSLFGFATSPDTLAIALPAAASVAFISLLETLLAAKVVDELKCEEQCVFFLDDEDDVQSIGGSDGSTKATGVEQLLTLDVPTSSALALAAGNGASALLGGMGGCGLIPQTVLNLESGGGGRLSSAAYAAGMATFVLALAPVVGEISTAALAGLMISVAISTVQWKPTLDAIQAALPSDDDKKLDAARVSLIGLVTSTAVGYYVDFASGVVLGVAVERGLTYALEKRE